MRFPGQVAEGPLGAGATVPILQLRQQTGTGAQFKETFGMWRAVADLVHEVLPYKWQRGAPGTREHGLEACVDGILLQRSPCLGSEPRRIVLGRARTQHTQARVNQLGFQAAQPCPASAMSSC